MNTQQDLLTIGGHTFTSRFILGSGKYSLELIQAAIEKAGAQIVTLALRRANEGGLANILDYIPDNVPCSPTPPARAMPTKRSALPISRGNWAAATLSKLK